MQLPLYQVDAFASKVFEGNPAAVCPLDEWLDDELLQQIAEENNLSETAFFVATEDPIRLRWFTPVAEVELCGHATLAAAHVLFTQLNYAKDSIRFSTRSGELEVTKDAKGYAMRFPAAKLITVETPAILLEALDLNESTISTCMVDYDYMLIFENQHQIENLSPDFSLMQQLDKRGVIVSAPGDDCDFVSRCFYPKLRINEDPVTGSAHCQLTPYWSNRLGKNTLSAQQLSKRSGTLTCELADDQVVLTGNAVDYLSGSIRISDD
jgi:PhzF family phenazine biosynthesis protein